MRLEIEFIQRAKEEPEGRIIRRNSGQFANEADAETYGLTSYPDDADGFRILAAGIVRRTVTIPRH